MWILLCEWRMHMSLKAKDIMTVDVIVVKPDETLEQVANILLENGISGLPVVDDEENIVGMISEGDLVFQNRKLSPPAMVDILGAIITVGSQEQYFQELKKTLATNVVQLMATDIISVGPNQPLEDIATLMIEKQVNRIPVVEGKRLLGIITRQDLIRAAHRN